jgi:hypothetical protein
MSSKAMHPGDILINSTQQPELLSSKWLRAEGFRVLEDAIAQSSAAPLILREVCSLVH